MDRIRLLGIAPYEGMRLLMKEIATNYPEVEMTALKGDLEEGLAIAREADGQRYDVILSRGGTAELLRGQTSLPVVEVGLSVYDVLRAFRLVRDFSGRHAVVGFPAITTSAYILRDLLQMEVDVITIHRSDEAEPLLVRLKEASYHMVIGDMVTCRCAQRLGMDNILITSGAESVSNAINEALSYCRFSNVLLKRVRLLEELLRASYLAVFGPSGDLVYQSLPPCSEGLLTAVRKKLPVISGQGEGCSFRQREKPSGHAWQVTGRSLPVHGDRFVVFTFYPDVPDEDGPRFFSAEDMRAEGANVFSDSRLQHLELRKQLDRYMQLPNPMIFIGEEGVGKISLARRLYLQSDYRVCPMVSLSFAELSLRALHRLLESDRSVLTENGRFILFSHCEKTDPDILRQLNTYLENTGLCQRNKLIFTFTQSEAEPEAPLFTLLTRQYRALVTRLPPLRSSPQDAYNLVSLSISALNVELGKQIIGMDDESLIHIQNYAWPGNFFQFQQVMRQLIILCDGNLITEDLTRTVLQREETNRPIQEASSLDLTLSQQTRRIVLDTLRKEGNNQTRAAKRLGISRSTLWRLLRHDG